MKALILILNFWFFPGAGEPTEFCEIVKSVVAKEKLESIVQHESNLLGKCMVVYQTKSIKDKFDLGTGDYECSTGRIVVFSDAEMFGYKIEKGIQFDKIKLKKNRVEITYSILEFYLDGKPGGLKRKILSTKKVSLTKTNDGYQ
ncbi:MAG: hypothetical protein DYG99_16570 [Bacteroidetes bacterium CHB5]|nr:hypothetical protein [Bacteroidetes bacterium CHB5]